MLEALTAASDALYAAIEGYSAICLNIQRSYARGEQPHIANPQLRWRMEAEVKLAASLEVKLRKAIAAINWSTNRSNTRATINSLPSELLARVFHIAHGALPRAKRRDDCYEQDYLGPRLPTAFALVCSRWREIAFSTPTLWPHIDLSTARSPNRQRFDPLKGLHLSQVGPLPLYLHIFDSEAYHTPWGFSERLKRSITQLASRVISFELDIRDFTSDNHVYRKMISTFFNNCTPGKLKQLTLAMLRQDDHVILRRHGNWEFEKECLDVPTEQLEDILSYVTVLRLSQMSFPWDSRAYHGLAELRLVGPNLGILESTLIDILRFSPDLRILQLSLEINDPLLDDSQITPILLNNLRLLNLVGLWRQAGVVLRWLTPSSKPVLLSVAGEISLMRLEIKDQWSSRFFSYAYIPRVYGHWVTPSQVVDLLDMTPNLREMAVRMREDYEASRWEFPGIASERQLDSFHMASCQVNIGTIIGLINTPLLTIKRLSFYRCEVRVGECWIPVHRIPFYIAEIAQMYPAVSLIIRSPEEPNPIESWNLYKWYQDDDG